MVNVSVNGQQRTFDGDPSMPLMWYLRDELGLTGTKFGCGVALCGACTVHLDGEAIRSCGIIMSDVAGKSVVTIEGLDPKGEHPVQVAWRNLSVPHRAEMGTGAARTTLPMIVADELEADWSRVRVVQSPGDEETYGNQDTDGSRSVRHFIQPMRQIGAGARKMLETAAAKRWNVD